MSQICGLIEKRAVISFRKVCLLFAMCVVLSFLCVSNVRAIDLEKQKQALNIIKEFADGICSNISTQGSVSSVEVSLEARVELSKLLSKMADIGVGGSSNHHNGEWSGILQKDLAGILLKNMDCKLEVVKLLNERILSSDHKDSNSNSGVATSVLLPISANQAWKGSYVCAQGRTFLKLIIKEVDLMCQTKVQSEGCPVLAVFDFDYNNGSATGAYYLRGDYFNDDGRLILSPNEIIRMSPGYHAVGMKGKISSGGRKYSGEITDKNCGEFTVYLENS